MLNVNIFQMKYALEIAKTGSISKAARNLFMNQPNLSKSIKELESTLGFAIFVRTRRGVSVTKEGQVFLKYADEILHKLKQLEKEAEDIQENSVHFSISIPRATYITYAFTKFIEGIRDRKEISINYTETNNGDAIENILHYGYDLGILRYTHSEETEYLRLLEINNLAYKEIGEFRCLLLMSSKHPLAEKAIIHREDLKEYLELSNGDISVPQPVGHQNKHFHEKQKYICLRERGSQFDLLCSIPEAYMWVSPIPDKVLTRYGLIQRKCSDVRIAFKDMMIFRPEYLFPQFLNEFLHVLNKVKEEIKNTEQLCR